MEQNKDIVMDVKMNNKCFPDIAKLAAGQPADEGQIREILDYINLRYDCADFRMVCVLRTLFKYGALVSPGTLNRMRQCVLGFKYWMDEPGRDSMCYWSENHQLLFAACEYLSGQMYPNESFTNSGLTGRQHMEKAARRLDIWFETRFLYGFVEWHSNTYYEEDIAPLSLLIDCCEDETVVRRAAMLLDLLLLDIALHSYRGLFCATSGRCYEAQKKDPLRQDVLDIAEKAFGFGNIGKYDYTRLSADFILNQRYQMPPVLYEIAHHKGPAEIRDSMGLALVEADREFPDKKDPLRRGMYLWSMEAFTNPQSANQTLDIFNAWDLKHNDFLKNIRAMDVPVVKQLGLTPTMVRLLNPVTQGIAIQRANCLTWKTPHTMLSSAQCYHPGEFGDQQHIWQATIGRGVTIFTTHPGAAFFEDNARNFSPSYWVGNGINPHAAQHKNVCLCLYDLRVRKGLLEKPRQWFTHAWFPARQFDEIGFHGPHLATARSGDGYAALFSLGAIERAGDEELIQRGKVTAWAVIVEDAGAGGYQAFVEKARQSRLTLDGRTLRFEIGGDLYALAYRRDFAVNGVGQAADYLRLESPYATVPRKPGEYRVSCSGRSLRLRWQGLEREVDKQ
ncbi:MAG: hypothetical protein LBS62_02820 [Clostridiales bacterium]|jgi:hypothetical protein|nr:hypothetical protein [Clostridiales bacterium]